MRIENQAPESVRVIKIIDNSVPASAPTVTANVPSVANAGETFALSAQTEANGVPAVSYAWDFGDGTSAEGPKVSHTYTRAGNIHRPLDRPGHRRPVSRRELLCQGHWRFARVSKSPRQSALPGSR